MFILRTDTHFLSWKDFEGSAFNVRTIRPVIRWVDDVESATQFTSEEAFEKLKSFPPKVGIRIAQIRRFEIVVVELTASAELERSGAHAPPSPR